MSRHNLRMTNPLEVYVASSVYPLRGRGVYYWRTVDEAYMCEGRSALIEDITRPGLELMATINVLLTFRDRPIQVISSSEYLIDGVTKYLKVWRNNGWLRANSKNEIANAEAWKDLDSLLAYRLPHATVTFVLNKAYHPSIDHARKAASKERKRLIQKPLVGMYCE